MSGFAEQDFKRKLDRALERVRVVLGDLKHPCLPADAVHHRYQDKYHLAECVTNAAAASQTNCLLSMGLSSQTARQLHSWAQGHAVSLSFRAVEKCAFEREETREVEGPKVVEEASVLGRAVATHTTKVVTTITEHFWRFESGFELFAVRGVGANQADRVRLCGRGGSGSMKTLQKTSPFPAHSEPKALEVNISWLLRSLQDDASAPRFAINREHSECRTPRRNPEIEAAFSHFAAFSLWATSVSSYLGKLASVDTQLIGSDRSRDLGRLEHFDIFVPVLPCLQDAEAQSEGRAESDTQAVEEAGSAGIVQAALLEGLVTLPTTEAVQGATLMGVSDVNSLLAEEQRCLRDKRETLARTFPATDCVVTVSEAALYTTLNHCVAVCAQHREAVDYIESMLRSQLVAAIGKEVSSADFAEYMRFHNRKLFADAFAPVPFCFSVRRSAAHNPEGTISIEQTVVGDVAEPITTLVARSDRPRPMQFPLSASAQVTFGGDRYLHAWLSHQFSGGHRPSLSLVSRARQFSSMIVLVGRIASASTFEPTHAAIVRDKDELKIPLELSTIPTPKEFKDAIESLSPEQQRFAKAFRAMQLESTLFGVVVIQIRPQLEKVLNLPGDALTKDIKLTQQLMDLFITYQISSDLLSFDGDPATPPSQRLAAVQQHVAAINAMLDEAKAQEVQDANQSRAFRFGARGIQPAPQMPVLDLLGDCFDDCEGAMEDFQPKNLEMKKKSKKKSAAPSAKAMFQDKSAAPSPPPTPPTSSPAPASSSGPAKPADPPPEPDGDRTAERPEQEDAFQDYTQMPIEMDRRFEELDEDNALRPTIIAVADLWTKRSQKSLLASPTSSTLSGDSLKREKDAAYDLLDALTKSGALPVEHASLHVVLAATHCFDKTVTETVVQDNVSPIEKVERSTLIMASTVHGKPAAALIRDSQRDRVQAASPKLFLVDGSS